MAPPIPLPAVAGTIALSFTTGRAAPEPDAVDKPPIQAPEGVPKPPKLPDEPGDEGAEEASSPTADPDADPSTETESASPDSEVGTPPPPASDPEPAATVEPPPDTRATDPFDVERAPGLSAASAPRPSLLRATDKRFFFNLFVGGAKRFRGAYSYFPGMDFKTEIAVGGHGKKNSTIGGAAVLQVTSGFPFNSFTLAPRLQFDRQILPDYAFYFTTTLTLGYRATTYAGYGLFQGLGAGAYHSALMAAGWGISAIVAERVLLSFRPVNVELAVPGPNLVDFNWDVLGGIGTVW